LYLLRGSIYTEIAREFFDKEMERLARERSEELERRKEEEIGELAGEEGTQWNQIKSGYSEDEIEIIENSRNCKDCGGRLDCTKKICNGIKIFTGKYCVYNPPIPGAQKLGVCEDDPKMILKDIKNAQTCFRAMDLIFTVDSESPIIKKYEDVFEMAVVINCFRLNSLEEARSYLREVDENNLIVEYSEADYYYYGSMIYYLQEDYETAMSFAEQLKLKSLEVEEYKDFAISFVNFIPNRINLAKQISIPLDILFRAYEDIIPKTKEKILRDKLNKEYTELGGIEIIVPEEIELEEEEVLCGNDELDEGEICDVVDGIIQYFPSLVHTGYSDERIVDFCNLFATGDCDEAGSRLEYSDVDLAYCSLDCMEYAPGLICADADPIGDRGTSWFYYPISFLDPEKKMYSSVLYKGSYKSEDSTNPCINTDRFKVVKWVDNPKLAIPPRPEAAEVEERVMPCFLPKTKILMANNNYKNIENIKINERVMSFNEETKKSEPKKVTEIYIHKYNGKYLLINNKLKVTPDHRIFINGEWDRIDKAKVGDKLKGVDKELVIYSIKSFDIDYYVYNLEIEDNKNYYAEGILVHNIK
jgi:hypothetical protein